MNPKVVYRNMSPAWLTEQALLNGEGVLSDTGALVVRDRQIWPAGHRMTSSSSICRPSTTTSPGTTSTGPFPKEKFNALKSKILAYFQNRPIYLFDGFAGAGRLCRKNSASSMNWPANVSSSALIQARQHEELAQYGNPDFTILVAPGFQCNPQIDSTHSQAAILVDYESRTVLIAGTRYAGESRRASFRS